MNKSPHFAISGKEAKIKQSEWGFVRRKQAEAVNCDSNVQGVGVEWGVPLGEVV